MGCKDVVRSYCIGLFCWTGSVMAQTGVLPPMTTWFQPCPPPTPACPPGSPTLAPASPTMPELPGSPAAAPTPTGQDPSLANPAGAGNPGGDFDLGNAMSAASGNGALAPNMLGDFIGFVFERGPTPLDQPIEIAQHRVSRRYKVGDLTSPIPNTRLTASYNFFQNPFETEGQIQRFFGGIEVAFFNQIFSLELKDSLNTFNFPASKSVTQLGQLRTTGKAVLVRTETFIFSSGLAIGWPTGPQPEDVPRTFVYSPFVGYYYAPTNTAWFLHGFEQIDIPSIDDDQWLLHTDIGVGRWIWRDQPGWLRAATATLELHLYTPVGDSPTGTLENLVLNDVLNLTVGATGFVGDRFRVSVGVGIPLANQRDYDIEGQVHLEWYFGAAVSRNLPTL